MDSLKSCLLVATLSCLFSLCSSLFVLGPASKGNETDRAALLEFRGRITEDPDHIFSSWNDTVHFCHWPGITCGRRHPRVVRLELPGSRLGGSLPPHIGNLSFLRIMNLEENSFTGEIPPELGNLRRFMVMHLNNNSFSGQLPENISGCTNLGEIRLRNSKLVGELPLGLAALSGLRIFQISENNFTGELPVFFGNFSFLQFLAVADNNFRGTIPASLGRLKKLQSLGLYSNLLSGSIPASIFNITSLEYLDFEGNQLDGCLPPDLGTALPNLIALGLTLNHLTGPIPPTIGNATNLQWLQISKNNFSGLVPDLGSLNRLQVLSISINQLGRGTSGDLSFVESLNSTELRVLTFNDNNFGGVLPRSMGNLSSNLNILAFAYNQLTGIIPPTIGNLINLETLFINANSLTGNIPGEIGNLQKLKHLEAVKNRFSGQIPLALGNLTMLMKLFLSENELNGSIPASLRSCQNLILLDLSRNKLSGTIPSQVLSIPSLTEGLYLSYNKLIGALPEEIGSLNKMSKLTLKGNRLTGPVPNTLGHCTSLVQLSLGKNRFEGNISSFLSPLQGLEYLDLSQNNFSGEVPKFLENFQLIYLDLSFNHFNGEIPSRGVFLNASRVSVLGNDRLCGGISELNLPRCPALNSERRRKISSKLIIVTACVISILFLVLLLLATYVCMSRQKKRNTKAQPGSVPKGPFPQISYEDILRATEGLNLNNLIGAGSFGSVYKGVLQDRDSPVAIKVLDLRPRAASKSFVAECEALRNIRHRNLVKIFTACSTVDFQGNEFKALVYEYMENGSLEDWLHPKVASERVKEKLSLMQRLSISIDVASAVVYLHHDCETPIIHCDIKPSNVLLDAEKTAHVGDFGLARILSTKEVVLQTSSVGVRGTIGYSPPEYGTGTQVSREGDIYSYGILLLEVFTGKRPTDDMFVDALNIRSYCEAALPESVGEIADPSLFWNEFGEGSSIRAPRRMRECLVKLLEVGIGCCRESPGERMDIREAVAKLWSIKASGC